jgi:hypothetical protein
LRAVFVGFNPSPLSVAKGHYYQGPHGRTLWGRLARYGILPNAPKGMEDEHGRILETALRESLRESNRHKVWQEDTFRVSRAADALVGSQSEDACRQSSLPYGDSVRTIQVDMVAFDSADQTIRAYEVKRGNGQFDAGKIRSIKRDLLCVQVLLKSYGVELAKLKPVAAESRIIFYFGVRSIPRPWSLVREELDDHFGFPVVERIEEANEYFRTKLHQLLETP